MPVSSAEPRGGPGCQPARETALVPWGLEPVLAPPMKAESSKMMNRRERECCWCKGDRPPPSDVCHCPFPLLPVPCHPEQTASTSPSCSANSWPCRAGQLRQGPIRQELVPSWKRKEVREGEGSWKQVLACAWGPRGWNLGSGRLCHES